MTNELLNKIKEFAYINMDAENAKTTTVYFDHNGMAITNPWIDESARFPLSDIQAVETYGLANVMDFCEKAIDLALKVKGVK